MIEAKQKIARWPFVDVGTFIRVLRIAYRQDYERPACEIGSIEMEDVKEDPVVTDEVPVEPSAPGVSDEYRTLSRKSKKKSIYTAWDEERPIDTPLNKVLVRQAFENFDYSMQEPILERYKPVPNQSSKEDYTPVLLGHTRLYIRS